MKKRYFVFLALVLIIFWSVAVVPGNAETVTKSFTLHDFDMTLAFPKTANPGDSVLVSVNAVAKSSVNVIDLSVQVLAYVEGGDLQSIGSASLASSQYQSQYQYQYQYSQYQYVYKGNTLHKEFSVTIPTGILRGALVAVVSETTRSTGYSYYSYPYYYSYYGYYPYYYGSYNGYSSDHMYYYWYYPYYYTYYYPETYYNQYVESKTLPSTYVLATTPEYVQLKSDYDSLSADYQKLSSQYNDLSAKYQQAMDQNKDLSDRLSAATQNMNIATVLAIVFLVTTIILAVYAVHVSRKKKAVAPTTITPTVATPAAVAPPISEPEKVTATPEKKQVPKKTTES